MRLQRGQAPGPVQSLASVSPAGRHLADLEFPLGDGPRCTVSDKDEIHQSEAQINLYSEWPCRRPLSGGWDVNLDSEGTGRTLWEGRQLMSQQTQASNKTSK